MVDNIAPGSAPGANADADALAAGDTGATPDNNTDSANATAEGVEGPVPYDRFKDKLDENKVLLEANEDLRRTLQSLVEKPAAPAPVAPTPVEIAPPETLSPDQKLQWYLQKGAREHTPAIIDEYLKENIGLDAAGIKQTLDGLRQEAKHSIEARFGQAAKGAGLAVTPELRKAVVGIMKSGNVSIEDAVTTLKSLAPPAPVAPAPDQDSKDMLTGGLTGTATVTDHVPTTFAEANQMARDGKAIAHIDTADILAHGVTGKG